MMLSRDRDRSFDRLLRIGNSLNEPLYVIVEPTANEVKLEPGQVAFIRTDMYSPKYFDNSGSIPGSTPLEMSLTRSSAGALCMSVWIMSEIGEFDVSGALV